MQGFKKTLVLILILLTVFSTNAQKIAPNRYGLAVIKDKKTYKSFVKADSSKKMIELKSLIPGLEYELKYAGTDNFMKTSMYPADTRHTFLRLPAARALVAVQQRLNSLGYGLKVWDAYRPYSVTEKFWEMVKDERYAANPAKGSGHNRGIAIDVTIVDLATGKELDMGTGFDNFTDTAHHVFSGLDDRVLSNRKLLKETMESCGFRSLESEWWHYSLPNHTQYELLDISFSILNRFSRN